VEMTESDGGLPTLLSPVRIGPMELRNRVVMAPHSTHYSDRIESERLTAYYLERARGGVGMIVHEPVIVHPSSLTRVGKIWGYLPENVDAYRRTTDAVHDAGARIVCQILHNGRQVDGYESGMPAWYPSEAERGGTIEVTHMMSIAEIEEVITGFADAAAICERGGFDGVEIHASHGYLLQGFLSPATNLRTDEYGGSTEGRLRIVREIIAAVRERTSDGFVVGVRLAGDEVQPQGLDEAACVEIACLLAPEVDYISVVSGSLASYDRIVPDGSFARGFNVPYASAIRKAVDGVPVMVAGRIAEPEQAEAIVAEGHADLVVMARALIADPAWVRKAAAGRPEEIRPCVYGNYCRDSIAGRRALACMVNPVSGNELQVLPGPPERRTIAVVGGGVAGLEAAIVASERGDRVVLFEEREQLGGQLRIGASLESGRLLRHLEHKVRTSGAEVRLGAAPDEEALRELAPDLIVVATGAVPVRADADAIALEVIERDGVAAETVVVEDRSRGNGWPLFAAVEALAQRGRKVVLVTGVASLGTGIEAASMPPLLRRLKEHGVRIEMMSAVVARDAAGVHVRRNDTGEVAVYPGAALVVEAGRRSAGDAGPWSGIGVRTVVVGDALAPRRISTAIVEGRNAVLEVPAA